MSQANEKAVLRSMPAGRELDALAAERVMGWRTEDVFDPLWYSISPLGDHHAEHDIRTWHPSTDIAAAWEVHRIACREPFSRRRAYLDEIQRAVSVRLGIDGVVAWPDVFAVVLPEDICRAALLAVKNG